METPVQVFPVEFVMRGYLTGSTSTSIWKNYEKGMRKYCGHQLPDGMSKNQPLPMGNLLTPTTKVRRGNGRAENRDPPRLVECKRQNAL